MIIALQLSVFTSGGHGRLITENTPCLSFVAAIYDMVFEFIYLVFGVMIPAVHAGKDIASSRRICREK